MSSQSWQPFSASHHWQSHYVHRSQDETAGRLMRAVAAVPVRAFLSAYHRLHIEGREHLPASGSFVMVANHSSHLDVLCLLAALPVWRLEYAHPAASKEYFSRTRHSAFAAFLTNAVPLERDRHLRRSLDLCRRLLATPQTVLILFPEGTRTTTGNLGTFRAGIGALVAGRSTPVIPCAIRGTFEACPKGVWIPRPRKLSVRIGLPRCFADMSPGRATHQQIAEELQCDVTRLLHTD